MPADINDNLIALPGYTLYLNSRTDTRGGGVCIYKQEKICNQSITAIPVNNIDTPPSINSLWLEIRISGTKFLIACIYRPGNINQEDNKTLLNTLTKLFEKEQTTFIFGDFNYPGIDWKNSVLSKYDEKAADFLEAYAQWNCKQMVNFPTRYRGNQKSLLDLILVNDKKVISQIEPLPPLGMSDHITILTTVQLKVKLKPTRKLQSRNFWKANYDEINNFLSQQDFIPDNQAELGMYNKCEEIMKNTIEHFIPLKPKKVNPQKPWLNQTIFKQINKKRNLWDRYKKTNSEKDYRQYRTQNNKLKAMIIHAREQYEISLVDASDKQFYTYIRRTLNSNISLLVVKNKQTNQIITDPFETAEEFSKQFSNVFTIETLENFPKLDETTRNRNSLSSINFTPQKVEEALMSMKKNSSPGPDGIPTIFLQQCAKTLCIPLSSAMNESMEHRTFPKTWSHAYVTPIFKKGDKYNPANYRPISLTCNPCKCMEKIITKELTGFLLQNNVIPDTQHGFLLKRSVVSNLLTCVDKWTQKFDDNEPVDIVYLDYEKAFDKVPHERLIYKLEHVGVRGNLLMWIKKFLSCRTFQVRANGHYSNSYTVTSGVPQGSVLGPLLFIIYISDLAPQLQSNVLFFADDTKIFGDPLSENNQLEEDLRTLEEWTNIWQLKLNENKCTILHIGTNNPRIVRFLNNVELQSVNEQKDLGVIITENLKWESHIFRCVKSANKIIYFITKAFKNHSTQMILKLYKSYVRPKLEHAHCIWNPYYIKDIELLERVQRKVTKIPIELQNLPYEIRLERMRLTTLKERRHRGDLIETFKIINHHYSSPIQIFHKNNNTNLRGHSKKLDKERCSKFQRKNFITNRIVYTWNALSEETISANNVNTFKNRLDVDLQKLTRTLIHY